MGTFKSLTHGLFSKSCKSIADNEIYDIFVKLK